MSTTEYIRDSRFKVLGLGVYDTIYDRAEFYIDVPAILETLKLQNCGVVAHHAHFDCLILYEKYGVSPAFIYDTLSMARMLYGKEHACDLNTLKMKFLGTPKEIHTDEFIGLTEANEAVKKRAVDDVKSTWEVFDKMRKEFPGAIEYELIDKTIRMYSEPALLVDQEQIKEFMDEENRVRQALFDKTGYTEADFASADRFAEILRKEGVDPPIKANSKGKEIYAFAKTDQGLTDIQTINETVSDLVDARLAAKSTIRHKRAERILDYTKDVPTLPIYLAPGGAKNTMRWSGGDKINPQNFPKGTKLRTALTAPDGYLIDVKDYSQIEVRFLGWLTECDTLLDVFRDPLRDIYVEFIPDIYDDPTDDETKTKRFVAKQCILGLGYGMAWKKHVAQLAMGIGGRKVFISPHQAMRNVQAYRTKFNDVKTFWEELDRVLEYMIQDDNPLATVLHKGEQLFVCRKDEIEFEPTGIKLKYPKLRGTGYDKKYTGLSSYNKPEATKIYGAKLTENMVQFLSRMCMAEAFNKISKEYKIVLCTHDEVATLIPEKDAEQHSKRIKEIMLTNPKWCSDIPLAVEGSFDKHYQKF